MNLRSACVLAAAVWASAAVADVQHRPNDPGHWYPMECCSLQDCGEAETVKMVPEGRIVRQIRTGIEILIPINAGPKIVRPNLHDAKYHVCIRPADPEYGATQLLCWFEPPAS